VQTDVWVAQTAWIVQAFPGVSDIQGSPSPAVTLYLTATIDVPFWRNGQPAGSRPVETLVVQHFSGPDPATSTSMELFYYGRNLGKYGWAPFFRTPLPAGVNVGPALAARWPAGLPYSAPPAGMVQTDARFWTNEVPEPAAFVKHSLIIPTTFQVASAGWPAATSLTLP
jgi:hypothetical protein